MSTTIAHPASASAPAPSTTEASEPAGSQGKNAHGYHRFAIGGFEFERDEFFAHIRWSTGAHVMSVDAFLRALQRDVAWNFFYGTVNFDGVFGTVNHYGTVDVFVGRFNDAYRKA
ncbi:MAG: hydroxyquinol 1,2-dioxygenase, partial [Acidimicrobiales bacterium]